MSDAYRSDYPQRPEGALPRARLTARAVAAVCGLGLVAAVLVLAQRRAPAPAEAGFAPVPAATAPASPQAQGAQRADVAQDGTLRLGHRPSGAMRRPWPDSPLRRQFEEAPDLYAYAQTIRSRADAGEPEAIWLLSRVYDYCAGFANAPVAYGEDTRAIERMGLRTSAAMVAARQRVSSRCARFVPEDNLSYPLIVLKRVEAAKAGSLPAEASLLAAGKPLEKTEEYRNNLVDRVLRSKDPEAFTALSSGMGIAASGRSLAPVTRVAGTQFAELAWQLAACELGQDCSAESSLMTSYCANGGICSQDPQQDFAGFVYDAAIPRQGAQVVKEMVDSLVSEKRMVQ